MEKEKKHRAIVFAREGFKKFYSENHVFLENPDYKPGKKMYRNMTALNKMMECYLDTTEDFIKKEDVKEKKGWDGPSTYAQYERIITNFGLSDTSWKDRDRSVLLLSDSGRELRDKYKAYVDKNPDVDLANMEDLPEFAREYLIEEIKNTTSSNMTLWKNVILSGIYLYSVLGRIPRYTTDQTVPEEEKRAFIDCCNYVNNNNELMDVSYFVQPAHMLRNLKILDEQYELTDIGYDLIFDLKLLKEMDSSFDDYKDVFEEEVDAVVDILDDKVKLSKVAAPERKVRNATVKHKNTKSGPKTVDFEESERKRKKTGDLGERLVLEYEKERLTKAGIKDIDEKVFLTSLNSKYGNAYPCDIISVDEKTGAEIYIEVKTTRYGIDAPFFISEDERAFSEEYAQRYRLYRVFDAIRTCEPKFYETHGYVGDNFTLTSDRYIATRDKQE